MPKRNTKTFSVSLLPDFLEKIDIFAQKEGRTRADLVREALRHYMEKRERMEKRDKKELR